MLKLGDRALAWVPIKSYLSAGGYLGINTFYSFSIYLYLVSNIFLQQLMTTEQTHPNWQICLLLWYLFCWIHDLFLLSTADRAVTGQLLSPRFSDLIFAFFMSSFYQATVLVKWKLSINPSYPPLLSAEEITINIHIPVWLETKNCLYIKNLLGLSGFDPKNSAVIHISSKTRLSKNICTHIHQMPPKKDEK